MLRHARSRNVAVLLLWLAACGPAAVAMADVKLPGIFGTNMALQAGREVNVWGWADPGEEVRVAIDGLQATATAAADGTWRVKLPAHAPGGPHVLEVSGKNQIRLENVVYGQVWLNAGQSNMYWPVRLCKDAEAETAKADDPDLRLFTVTEAAAEEPLSDLKGKWDVCTPKTAAVFSGVAYFFGRRLRQDLGQPVGLIAASVGNSRINLWIPHASLRRDEDYPVMLGRSDAMKKDHDALVAKWEQDLAAWKERAKPDEKPPVKPQANPPFVQRNDALGTRHHGMISPLGPLALAGVNWYQGESNVDRGVQYFRLLPLLIASLRSQFESPQLPVMVVQLPNMHGPDPKPPANAIWSEVRAAQAATAAADPDVGLAVTIDIGNLPNESPVIHPANKQDVGDRLARKALAIVYGKDLVHSGPTYKTHAVEGGKLRITFDDTQGGLVTNDGKAPRAFTLAGRDDVQHWADAVIDGDSVVLSSPNVPEPVWARYAWTNNPNANLYGKAGLPAAPFRTDALPLSTRLNH
jgi:sialate O-acetylesterase